MLFFSLSFASGDYQSLQEYLSHWQLFPLTFALKCWMSLQGSKHQPDWQLQTKIRVRAKWLSLWTKHKIAVRASAGECIGWDWKSQGEVPWSTAFKAKLSDVLSFQWNLGNSKENMLLAYWPTGWPSQTTLKLSGSHLITYRTKKHSLEQKAHISKKRCLFVLSRSFSCLKTST